MVRATLWVRAVCKQMNTISLVSQNHLWYCLFLYLWKSGKCEFSPLEDTSSTRAGAVCAHVCTPAYSRNQEELYDFDLKQITKDREWKGCYLMGPPITHNKVHDDNNDDDNVVIRAFIMRLYTRPHSKHFTSIIPRKPQNNSLRRYHHSYLHSSNEGMNSN